MRDIAEKFYRFCRNRGLAQRYSRALANDYLTLARWCGTPFPSTEDMKRWYQDQMDRELSASRLRNDAKLFKHLATFLETDPPDIRPPRATNRRVTYLTDMEATRLLFSCTDIRDIALLQVMLSGGLRRSEVVALKWDDIDLENRIISVSSTKTHETAECVISKKAAAALAQWKERCRSEKVFDLNPETVGRLVKKYARVAGIRKQVTPHVLRHTLATNMLLNGADITDVQRQLRHRSIESTLIYLHVTTEEHRKRYDRFSPDF